MSFNDKNNNKLVQVINKNNEMRNIIYESAENIEFLLKEFYKEQKRNKINPSSDNEYLNTSEIDNLPLLEQIELYKECIIKLQKETPEEKNNRIEIEEINREINELKLKINNEKKINNSLEKMNNNYLKILKNINIENSNLKKSEKETEQKILSDEYHILKEDYKNSLNIIKKQMNSLIILEDNCKFIGENIYFHKNNQNEKMKKENENFNEIKKIAQDVQNLKEVLEDKYENKIKKQKEEINKLKNFNFFLNQIIQEQKINDKLESINEAKGNHHKNNNNHEINNSNNKK